MNDYFVDEKLLKEFREMTLPNKEPLPYPTEKAKKYNHNLNSQVMSSNATHKKEYTDLLSKYRNLEKAYNKLSKKNTEILDEIKTLKHSNESLNKEINVLHITNEKLMGEKISAENGLEENKSYVRKIESRLVQGAKNQYLVEINNKLRKEVEESKKLFEDKNEEIEAIKNEVHKKNQEIKILHKALEIKVEELKFKGDIKSSLLYDVGVCKKEMDEYKESLDKISEEYDALKIESNEKDSRIQELTFAKAHLTELLVENENRNHNLEIEKNSYEKHCLELKEERKMLRDYIEKLCNESNEINETLNKDNIDLTKKCKDLENLRRSQEDSINRLTSENEGLKTLNAQYSEKIKTLENTLKNKIDEFMDLEIKYKNVSNSYEELQDKINYFEEEKNNLIKNNNDLNQQISDLERENMDLLKKNKVLLISQENFQTDIIKQNQQLQNNDNRSRDQLSKLNNDLENLKEERDNLKKLMNEALTKCSTLLKEKGELEKDNFKKSQQIENLKNTNLILHKNMSIGNENKNLLNQLNNITANMNIPEKDSSVNEEKIIKIGEIKLEENNMLNLIRKEKEKNKEFLDELRKLKNNI